MQKTITEIINQDYQRYAVYTLENRAIPSMIDGFKPVQRKIFHVMRNKTSSMKINAIAGTVIADTNYHHGDMSAAEAAIKMAQDFTGANNIPPLIGDGEFGSQLIPDGAASPRYVSAKINKEFLNLFTDYEICPASPDPEQPEPLFYLPTLPIVLLNGVKGIAVGFACEIQPYALKDLKRIVSNIVEGKTSRGKIKPHYKGYRGEIQFDDMQNKWVMCGVWEKINTTTIHITEIPTGISREQYITHLDKLQDKKLIHDYTDQSDSTWNITVKLPRESVVWQDVEKHLKLKSNLNENITVLDANGKIKVFNSVEELITEFINFRLSMYTKRKQHMVEKLKGEMEFLGKKKAFIQALVGVIKKGIPSKTLIDKCIESVQAEQYKTRLNSLPVHSLTSDTVTEIEQQIEQLSQTCKYYQEVQEKDLYLKDLQAI